MIGHERSVREARHKTKLNLPQNQHPSYFFFTNHHQTKSYHKINLYWSPHSLVMILNYFPCPWIRQLLSAVPARRINAGDSRLIISTDNIVDNYLIGLHSTYNEIIRRNDWKWSTVKAKSLCNGRAWPHSQWTGTFARDCTQLLKNVTYFLEGHYG